MKQRDGTGKCVSKANTRLYLIKPIEMNKNVRKVTKNIQQVYAYVKKCRKK